MAIRTFIFCCFFATGATYSQIPKEYYSFTKKADSLYQLKEYKNSGIAYSSAFKTLCGKGMIEDRYKAARSWSMANNADSAFSQLFRLTDKVAFKDYDRVIKEEDFKYLHSDKRWESLLTIIKENKSFNFGFERVTSFDKFPSPWFEWGTKDYVFRVDSNQKHSGKYSMSIEPMENISRNSFGCVAHSVPAEYEGKEIEVKAYIKFENVTEPIGFMLRIDGKNPNKSLGFDNMHQKKISGTKDWTQYSIKLKLPKDATTIYIGAFLAGTGKLWVDDFEVLIDGKDISEAKLKKKP